MQSPPPPPRRRQPVRSINPFAPIRHWGTCTLDVRGWVPKKQMNKLRSCEFYSVNQLPNADKGKGVQKSENFANVICVWSVAPFPPSFGRRKRNESSTRDPGRSGADQETVEEWMGKEDMLLNRGTPPSSLPSPLSPGRGPKVSERTHKSTVFSESKLCLFVGNCSIPVVPSPLSPPPPSPFLSRAYT